MVLWLEQVNIIEDWLRLASRESIRAGPKVQNCWFKIKDCRVNHETLRIWQNNRFKTIKHDVHKGVLEFKGHVIVLNMSLKQLSRMNKAWKLQEITRLMSWSGVWCVFSQ